MIDRFHDIFESIENDLNQIDVPSQSNLSLDEGGGGGDNEGDDDEEIEEKNKGELELISTLGSVVKEGWLSRKGKRNWTKKYFVLHYGSLTYFSTPGLSAVLRLSFWEKLS